MAATQSSRLSRKTKRRRHQRRTADICAWLRAGTVAAGLGAAMVAGPPVAMADTPNEETSTMSRDETDTRSEPSVPAPRRSSESRQSESDPSVEPSGSNLARATEKVDGTDSDGTDSDEVHADPDIDDSEESIAPVTAEPEHAPSAGADPEFDGTLEQEGTDAPGEAAADSPPPATVKPGTFRDSADVRVKPSAASPTSINQSESAVLEPSPSTTFDEVSTASTSDADQPATSARLVGPDTTPDATPDTTLPTTDVAETPMVAAPPPQRAAAEAQVTWRGIVSDVLTWLGLRPLAGNSPMPAAPVPPLLESLWLVVRQVQYSLNNRRPVATPTLSEPDPVTGDIAGSLNAVDYDGDQLTYVLATPPAAGEVTVDAAGNFVYRPGAELAANGGVDEFSVVIDDKIGNPPHLHGLLDLLGLVPPVMSTVRVEVAAAGNEVPDVTVTVVEGPDPDTGAVAFQIEATDPDAGDVPVLTITDAPDHGELTENPDGSFTYTPDRAYAHAVGAGEPDTDSFTVTAADGRGGVTSVVVPITVPFLNAAPTGTTEIADPHPQNGAITGALTAVDDDGDPVTYAVGAPPGKGSVSLDPDTGVWTYTPSFEARVAAAAVGAPADAARDTFVFTVSDGYSVQEIPVTVAVIAPHNWIVATIPVGNRPVDTVVSPDGSRVYVANVFSGTVTVIDTADNSVVATVAAGAGANAVDVAISRDGNRLYVVDSARATLSVIDTATNTVSGGIAVGGELGRVVLSPDGTRAYLTNGAIDGLTVIDTVTGTVVTTVSVGDSPAGAAISPDGNRVYVIHERDSVSVVDTVTNTVIDTVALGRATTAPDEYPNAGPLAIAVSPDGARVYVANYTFDGYNSVSVIDTTTNTVIGTSPVGIYNSFGVAAGSDGAHVYVTNYPDNTVAVIDTATGAMMAIIAVGDFPAGPSISPDSSHVYVPNSDDNTVSVISVLPVSGSYTNAAPTIVSVTDDLDLQTGVSTGTVISSDADADPLDLILTSLPTKGAVLFNSGTGMWTYTPTLASRLQAGNPEATDEDKEDSFIISASDNFAATPVVVTVNVAPLQITPLATIAVGDFPLEVAFSPDGSRAYVTNFVSNTVSVIDTATDTVIATVPVGQRPVGVAVSPDGARVYAASGVTNRISVIDAASNTVGSTITTPSSLAGYVVFHPVAGRGRAYTLGPDRVLVIDTVSNTVVGAIAIGDFVTNLAISPDGSRLYVTKMFNDLVSVIDTTTDAVVSGIGVGRLPDDLVVSGDGTRIYVGSDTVDVIDAERLGPIAAVTIPASSNGIPDQPGGVAVTPDGVAIFATNPFSDSVSVIDPASNTIVALVPVGDAPGRIEVSPDGTRVYVLNTVGDTVTVLGLVPVQ